MKLSTRIRKHVSCTFLGYGDTNIIMEKIVFMVDCNRQLPNGCELSTYNLDIADGWHNHLTKEMNYTLLPKESFVKNGNDEIIIHYTSTTYAEWCNSLLFKAISKPGNSVIMAEESEECDYFGDGDFSYFCQTEDDYYGGGI